MNSPTHPLSITLFTVHATYRLKVINHVMPLANAHTNTTISRIFIYYYYHTPTLFTPFPHLLLDPYAHALSHVVCIFISPLYATCIEKRKYCVYTHQQKCRFVNA